MMHEQLIDTYIARNDQLLSYLYEVDYQQDKMCALCQGRHGNNTDCQRND